MSLFDANTRNYVIKLSGTNDPFFLKAEIHDENGIKLGIIRDKKIGPFLSKFEIEECLNKILE